MSRLFTQEDAPDGGLKGQKVVIAGFGNQGRAQAECLRDEGVDLSITLRPGGESWNRAADEGFAVLEPSEGAACADILMLLTPDESQPRFFSEELGPHLRPACAVGFAHGYALGFGLLDPGEERDVFMVAPKAQGLMLRRLYCEGRGAAALIAVDRDYSGRAWQRALAYASALGCLRTGAYETTFREEAISDIFGEQAVLCGGLSELVRAAFDTLLARGVSPEIAYFECLHEVKILADLIHRHGIDGMRDHISGTALFGDLTRGRRIIDGQVRERMDQICEEIESGGFAADWQKENEQGLPTLKARRREDADHEIEEIGRRVRGLMPWLKEDE